MHSLKKIFFVLAATGGLISASATLAPLPTLTLTLNSVTPWEKFDGHAGSKNFDDAHAGLLNFTVTSQTGSSFGLYPTSLGLFCVELQQNIYLHSTGNVYTVVDAEAASSGVHAGYSANISLAGIGSLRTQSLEVLYAHVFGTNYNPTALSNTMKSAFQLAVWELSHDDNFNLKTGSGNQFWVTDRNTYVTEAQNLVNWVQVNLPTAARMELSALHNGTTQDFLIPTARDFHQLSQIPEPATTALTAGLAVFGLLLARRRLAAA